MYRYFCWNVHLLCVIIWWRSAEMKCFPVLLLTQVKAPPGQVSLRHCSLDTTINWTLGWFYPVKSRWCATVFSPNQTIMEDVQMDSSEFIFSVCCVINIPPCPMKEQIFYLKNIIILYYTCFSHSICDHNVVFSSSVYLFGSVSILHWS